MRETAALRVPPGARMVTPLCRLAQELAALSGWRRYGLAFLLGAKNRALNLLTYGAHLSAGLLDLARSLVPEELRTAPASSTRERWNAHESEDDSPYRD